MLDFAPLHHYHLSPSPPIPGTVPKSIVFAFTNICTHYLHCIHFPTPFSYFSPPTGANPPSARQNMFLPPVLQFCRRKKIKDEKKNRMFLLI
jgi:hypothetical protein